MKIIIEKNVKKPKGYKKEVSDMKQSMAKAMKSMKIGESFEIKSETLGELRKVSVLSYSIAGAIRMLINESFQTQTSIDSKKLTTRVWRVK